MRKFCLTCGKIDTPEVRTKGTFKMELMLWFLMVLPGLIYSVWRLTTRGECCPACGSVQLVPANSPVAQKFKKDNPSGWTNPYSD